MMDSLNKESETWKPDEKLEGDLASRIEMNVTNNPPKVCDCQHGFCELDDCLDDPTSSPSKSAPSDNQANIKADKVEAVADTDEIYNTQELAPPDTPTKEELEIHDDLGETCNSSMNNTQSRRQIKASNYQKLTWSAGGEEVFRAIMESNIEWQQVNWKEGCRYLALCRGYTWCRTSPLRRVLPWRRNAKGSCPGITGKGTMGPSVDNGFSLM